MQNISIGKRSIRIQKYARNFEINIWELIIQKNSILCISFHSKWNIVEEFRYKIDEHNTNATQTRNKSCLTETITCVVLNKYSSLYLTQGRILLHTKRKVVSKRFQSSRIFSKLATLEKTKVVHALLISRRVIPYIVIQYVQVCKFLEQSVVSTMRIEHRWPGEYLDYLALHKKVYTGFNQEMRRTPIPFKVTPLRWHISSLSIELLVIL